MSQNDRMGPFARIQVAPEHKAKHIRPGGVPKRKRVRTPSSRQREHWPIQARCPSNRHDPNGYPEKRGSSITHWSSRWWLSFSRITDTNDENKQYCNDEAFDIVDAVSDNARFQPPVT